MLSCTKGSLNHLFGRDSLKEKRGKVAVINVRSSVCSVELVLMAANAMPFQPPPPYSINILFHGCLKLQKHSSEERWSDVASTKDCTKIFGTEDCIPWPTELFLPLNA